MNNKVYEERQKPGWITVIASVYLVILYLALFAMIAFINYEQAVISSSPAPTTTTIPTPHILVHQPIDRDKYRVAFQDYSYGFGGWDLYYPDGKVEITNGKLVIQSYTSSHFAMGVNEELMHPSDKYYLQADFMTDANAENSYGLVFGLSRSTSTFYLFQVWPRVKKFALFRYASGKWESLVPYTRGPIRPYPEPNTLSAYFNNGNLELYINGNLTASYVDKEPFRSNAVGVFVNDAGYRVLVDNFFAYADK